MRKKKLKLKKKFRNLLNLIKFLITLVLIIYFLTLFLKKEEIKKEEEVRLFNGQTCSECGSSKLVQSGTCATCLDCGSTTGCS